MLIVADTLDDLLRRSLEAIVEHGDRVNASRGWNTEICGILLKLTNPRARLSKTETKGKVFSALGELAWYLAASDKADFISYYVTQYEQEMEIDGTVRGAYGPRLFSAAWHNQFESVAALLKRKPNSRQAVIQLFDHSDLAGRYKDIPCTCTLQFTIRNEKLNLTVSMRSNDAFKGLPHDVFSFTMLQEIMARMLETELGDYTHFAASLHLYDEQAEKAKMLLEEGVIGTVGAGMPPMPVSVKELWPSIRVFRLAEEAIRLGREVNSVAVASLDPYWQDLVRLLRVFQHHGNGDYGTVATIRNEMASPYYAEYIVSKEGLN